MVLGTLRHALAIGLAAAVVGAILGGTSPVSGGEHIAGGPDGLFHNYYAQPGMTGVGVTASMYPSPRPTPPLVGHTYVTYQPFMPHEYMYDHTKVYVAHPEGSGLNVTTARYHTRRLPVAVKDLLIGHGPLHDNRW